MDKVSEEYVIVSLILRNNKCKYTFILGKEPKFLGVDKYTPEGSIVTGIKIQSKETIQATIEYDGGEFFETVFGDYNGDLMEILSGDVEDFLKGKEESAKELKDFSSKSLGRDSKIGSVIKVTKPKRADL